jgi:feruloyl esterase
MTRANRDPATGATLLSAADVPLIHEAVLRACDGLDGLVDGVIDDPRACHFDPGTLQCPADGAASGCLSAAQVDALRLIYSPPRNSTGEPLYASGMVFGSEPQWPTWVTGTNTAPSLREVGSREALRYMAFEEAPGPSYDPATFDFDSDPPLLVPLASISNPDGPEALRTFQARGGKLLMWHGLADGAISPIQTIQYYTRAMEVLGGQARTQEFFRLFLFPGMFHCSGGYGPNQFDALTALEQWVEQGRAPDRVVASRVTNGTVDQTRPVFPYPLVARYTGTGSPDDAANFVPASAGRQ